MAAGAASEATTFAPAHGRRVFDDIIEQLRARILGGELRPGDRLPAERSLAEQFGVSRNTVREAVRMLEVTGLVTIKKGATGGVFVAHGDPAVVARSLSDMCALETVSFSDLREARLGLGTVVVRAACERATEAHLAALEENTAAAARLTMAEQWEQRAEVNHEFHDLLAAATGNPVLVMMQRSVTDLLRRIVSAVGPARDTRIIESRRRLVAAIRRRDPDAAAAEWADHLRLVDDIWLGDEPAGDPSTRTRA